MKISIIAGLILTLLGSQVSAQTGKKKPATPKQKTSSTSSAFATKKHLYFPDYYAFYDPNRGYVFWNEQKKEWNTSLQPPKFMSKVDMSKTRIQILEGLSLDLRPEQNYPNYMKLYPAHQNDPKVPVPNARISGGDGY
jgi:hypothetical protein